MNENIYYEDKGTGITLRKHMAKTYLWVFLGLLLSTITAFVTIYTGLFYYIYSSTFVYFGVIFGQLALVIYLSSRIYSMSYTAAILSYFGYSLLTGITLSSVLLVYTWDVIVIAFGLCTLLFADLAFIGYRTKVDLENYRGIFMAGLFMVLIASLVGMFIHLDGYQTVVCFVGLAVFLGVTAWDSQKMKKHYYMAQNDEELLANLSIYSALELYLDFLNIFLYIVRLLGNNNRRN